MKGDAGPHRPHLVVFHVVQIVDLADDQPVLRQRENTNVSVRVVRQSVKRKIIIYKLLGICMQVFKDLISSEKIQKINFK